MPPAIDARAQAQQHRASAEAAFDATLWPDAVREYEAALSLLSEHGDATGLDEAELLTRLGSCYWSMSEARTGWRTLRRAMALYRDRGDALGFAHATVEVLRIWGPWERQLAMADEALEMLGLDGVASETSETTYLRARLLMATAWRGRNERFDRAIEIAEKYAFGDILARRTENQAWQAFRETGDLETSIALHFRAHDEYAAAKAYEQACGALRGCGFSAFEHGSLDRGVEIARRCVDYARSVHLRFHEELALTDLAGEAFARADYERCHAVLGELTTNTDFRADLYRMWMVERSGDTRAAVQMMVDPERAGRAATGMSQTHGAAAGVLYRAGLHEPAKRELEQWAEIAGENRELAFESPVLFECIAALGDDDLVRKVCDSYETQRPDQPPPPTYATLSGRAGAPSHGAMLMRLGRVDDAERVYREGLAWCERERVPVDAGLCLAGLADVATTRGDAAAAEAFRSRARALFEQHGAKLYVERVARG
jgi:tetratricopeptide (TPR) repeat protein